MNYKKVIWIVIKVIVLIFLFYVINILIQSFSFSLLRTFGYSLLVLTIGIILDSKERWYRKLLKYIIYIGYAVYTLYNLGVIENLQVLLNMDALDWSTLSLGFIAPICMMIVGKRITAITVKGYKIFNYYTLWIIYVVLGIVWKLIYPNQVILPLLILYSIITFSTITYFKRKNSK